MSRRSSILIGLTLCLFAASRASAAPDFTREDGIRIATAVPMAVTGSYPSLRMYVFISSAIYSSTSTDGLIWVLQPGVRLSTNTVPSLGISSITAMSLLSLDDGGFRMLYSAYAGGNYSIVSATSADGLAWANESVRVSVPAGTFIGSPKLLELSNGDWRLFYVRDADGGTDPSDYRIYSALSTDQGVTWTTGVAVSNRQAGEIAVSTQTSGTVRIYFTSPATGETTNTQILSGLFSEASGVMSVENGVRFSTDSVSGALSFPLVVRSTESFRWRLYYAFQPLGGVRPHLFSALTRSPDLQRLDPSTVVRSDPAGTLTLRGEIFSPNPTARIVRSGQPDIVGTGVNRVDDTTITATFDTHEKPLGLWSVIVMNEDGESDTLTEGLTITFTSGQVSLVNNLLRPLKNQQTTITLTIFEGGQVKVTLHTLDGEVIRTLVDEALPIGTVTRSWDGKTDDGHLVASGTYVLRIEGPKLDDIRKVVVIK